MRYQIRAVCIDQEYGNDPFTFEATLDQQGCLNPTGIVGWYEDDDGRSPITGIQSDGTITFADGSSWDSNLLLRPIKNGETFAVGNNLSGRHGDDYWVYRIVAITPLS